MRPHAGTPTTSSSTRAGRMHLPIDASLGHDYTGWNDVEHWAHELAASPTPAVAET